MTEHDGFQEMVDRDQRMSEDAAIRLKVKTRESNWRIAFLAMAFVFVVVGVVVPVWLDKSDSDQRREDIDKIAANTTAIGEIVTRMDEDDSPEAQRLLERTVGQLVAVVRCDNRANMDDLLNELEARGISIEVPADPLGCVPPPVFTFPPPEDAGG